MSAKYYKKSGRVSLPAFVAALVLGGGAGIVLAAGYAYAALYNPIIYIQFIITIIFGALVGWVVTSTSVKLKSRNTLVDMLALLIVLGVAIWVYWAYWAHISGYGDPGFVQLSLQDKFMAGPMATWAYALDEIRGLGEFYELSIGKRGRSGGSFSGGDLHYLWAAEAAIIVLSALGGMLMVNLESAPYNEATKTASTLVLKTRGHGFDGEQEDYVTAFEAGDFSTLLALAPVPEVIENEDTGAEVKIYRDPGDLSFNLLTVEKLTYKVEEKEGPVSNSYTHIIGNLYITADQADMLEAKLPAPPPEAD